MSLEISDADLVQRIQEGYTEDFQVLFERHKGKVYNCLLSTTHNTDLAEEYTAEAFQRAYQALLRKDDVRNFGGWVYTIALNAFRDERRKQGREVSLEEYANEERNEFIADLEGSWQPEKAARKHGIRQLVWDAMAFLPKRYRLVLALNVQANLKPGEIAGQIGETREGVYTLLSRARGMMEENVTLLVVSKMGRQVCAELDGMLNKVELRRVTRTQRRVLLRHIETCAVCRETRKRYVSAAKLLALVPAMPVPAGLTAAKVMKGAAKTASQVSVRTAQKKVVQGAARQGAQASIRSAVKGWGMKALVGAMMMATATVSVLVVRQRTPPPAATMKAGAVWTTLDRLLDVPAYTVVGKREDYNGVTGQSATEVTTSTVSGGNSVCMHETRWGRGESYVIDGQFYWKGSLAYNKQDASAGQLKNSTCLNWLAVETNDVGIPYEQYETWYEWVGRETINGRVVLHYWVDMDGAFMLWDTIAGSALDFDFMDEMDCTGTDELWVDEREGFLVRYAAEVECRAEDGSVWRTQQSIEVTGVGQMKEIALPGGAVVE